MPLVVTVARGSAAAHGVEDDAAEGGRGEGVPEAEVAAGGGILGSVAVVENDGSDVVPVTLCHSPADLHCREEHRREKKKKKKADKQKEFYFLK